MDYRQNLPLISLDPDPDPPDSPYGVFLQADDDDIDIDYLAEESSTSATSRTLTDGPLQAMPVVVNSSLSSSSLSTAATSPGGGGVKAPSPANSADTSPPKQRLERRGHTKSRRGCFNCKRRRIKVRDAQRTVLVKTVLYSRVLNPVRRLSIGQLIGR